MTHMYLLISIVQVEPNYYSYRHRSLKYNNDRRKKNIKINKTIDKYLSINKFRYI